MGLSSSFTEFLVTIILFMACTMVCDRKNTSESEIQLTFLSPSQQPEPVISTWVTRARRADYLSKWPSSLLCNLEKCPQWANGCSGPFGFL